jgi:hypothetical protein
MVVWTGWGILAALIWVAGLGLTQIAVNALQGPGYYTANFWPKVVAGIVPAPFIWFVGRAMNGSPHSEARQKDGPRHTLFWVPMEYWSFLFIALNVVIATIHKFRHT